MNNLVSKKTRKLVFSKAGKVVDSWVLADRKNEDLRDNRGKTMTQELVKVEKTARPTPKLILDADTGTQIDQDVARLQDELGIGKDAIKIMRPQWANLMREGVLVNLHIRRWRAKTRLTLKDLGIALTEEEEQSAGDMLQLGVKKLLPAKIMKKADAIENRARRELERLSFRTHWGFFVPVTSYPELREVMDECEVEYMALCRQIVDDYDKVVEQVKREYQRIGGSTYGRLRKLNPKSLLKPGLPNSASANNERNLIEVADYVTDFVQRIEGHIPTAEQIKESFSFKMELFYIPLPDLLAEEEAAARLIQERTATDAAEEAAKREAIREQRRLEQYKLDAERQREYAATRAAESAAATKERMMREMYQDVVAQARRQKEQLIDGFLADIQGQLTNTIYDACTSVLAYITDEGKLHPRKVVQLKKMVEQVKALNFFEDQDAAAMIRRVQAEMNKPNGNRDLGELEEKLRDIAIITRQTLIGIGETPRSARDMGVPDVITPVELRQARQRLGLADVAVDTDTMAASSTGRLVTDIEVEAI